LKKFTRCINKFFKQAALNINEIELVAPTGFVRWWAETSPSRFAAWPFATSEHGPNPPYINVKQENLYLAAIQALPFFADWLHGDTNTYLLFRRVGLHFRAPTPSSAFVSAAAVRVKSEATISTPLGSDTSSSRTLRSYPSGLSLGGPHAPRRPSRADLPGSPWPNRGIVRLLPALAFLAAVVGCAGSGVTTITRSLVLRNNGLGTVASAWRHFSSC